MARGVRVLTLIYGVVVLCDLIRVRPGGVGSYGERMEVPTLEEYV